MHPKLLVKLSNTIGLVSIILLMYWIFAFISIEVFGFRIFRENMTETFYLSIVGILALLAGALMINVMFNLTRIAEKHNGDGPERDSPQVKKLIWGFALSFPLLFSLLYLGDFLSSRKKENMLVKTAATLIQEHPKEIGQLLKYSFDEAWLKEMDEVMTLLAKKDEHFPEIHLVVKDTINASSFYLQFEDYYYTPNDTTPPIKKHYIFKTNQAERDYLDKVFSEGYSKNRFSAHDGNYELFFPFRRDGKVFVFYFADYHTYGKFGS